MSTPDLGRVQEILRTHDRAATPYPSPRQRPQVAGGAAAKHSDGPEPPQELVAPATPENVQVPAAFSTLWDAQEFMAAHLGGAAANYYHGDPKTRSAAERLGILQQWECAVASSNEIAPAIDASVRRAGLTLREDRGDTRATAAVTPDSPPEPRDLWREPTRGPELDTARALPAALSEIADVIAYARGHDVGAIALSQVIALSACLRRRSRIAAHPASRTWTEGSALWGALLGESGTGKSPSMLFAVAPLNSIQRETAAGVATTDTKAARLVASDCTVEALGVAYANAGDRRMLAFRDEGASFLDAMGQYNGRADAERGNWCSAWNCNPHAIDRVTRESLHFDDWGVALLMGLTPSQMKRAAEEARQDGLLARMLQCVAKPATGREAPTPAAEAAVASWDRIARAVYDLGAITAHPDQDAALVFAEARAQFAETADVFAASNRQMAVWLRKAAANALRVALVFAATEAARGRSSTADLALTVNAATAERAVRFVNWSACHALAFSEINTPSTVLDLAQRVALFALSRAEDTITRRELSRYVTAWDAAPDERTRAAAIVHLFDAGWIIGTAGSRITRGPGLADATAWQLNPLARERFADYGSREIARRREVRARLLALGGGGG